MTSDPDRLLTRGEVAALFAVNAKTVVRWAAAGRFRASDVRALLNPPDRR